jgi:GR25 family glycosyltransferase involved in LPS biosynthesis
MNKLNFYIINLKKNEERLDWAMSQLFSHGISYENIHVVQDGEPDNNPYIGLFKLRGTAGCAWGHYKAIEKSSINRDDFSVILEDDFKIVVENFPDKISRIIDEIEGSENKTIFDGCYLKRPKWLNAGAIEHETYISKVTSFRKVCAHAVLMTKKFNDLIVNNERKFINGMPIDYVYHRIGTMLTSRESLCLQNKSFTSDIVNSQSVKVSSHYR